ncbi:MAG: fibronectin type III domain-containing protein [Anaerolineales bacterium]|nr:fibronectin type III domain-containing protein [Anaerolineales bacterium]
MKKRFLLLLMASTWLLVVASAFAGPPASEEIQFGIYEKRGQEFIISTEAFVPFNDFSTSDFYPQTDLSTGFEASEGFTVGATCDQNGWSKFAASNTQGQISNSNPQSGAQHIRISKDSAIAGGTLTGCFSPNLGVQPAGPGQAVVNLNITGTNGADYDVVVQAPSQGLLTARVKFHYQGGIWVLDDVAGTTAYVYTGVNWTPNSYGQLRIEVDPDNDEIAYYYDDALIFVGTVFAGTAIEQMIVMSDNYQVSEVGNFDNIDIVVPSTSAYPASCMMFPFGLSNTQLYVYSSGREWDFTAPRDMEVATYQASSWLATTSVGTFNVQLMVNGVGEDTWTHTVSSNQFQAYLHDADLSLSLQQGDTVTYRIYGGTASTAVGAISGTNFVKVCAEDLAPPAEPTNLAATAVSQTQINLTWNDNADDETSYRIERSPTGTTGWVEIDTAAANATSYSDTSLTCNSTYYYRVRAYRAGDTTYSSYSNADSSTTTACDAPAAPTNLVADAISQTQINLTWNDNAADETNYHIERSPDGSTGWVEIDTAVANATSYSDTSLICGTEYFYRVRAYRAGDATYSSYSNADSSTTTACDAPAEQMLYLPFIAKPLPAPTLQDIANDDNDGNYTVIWQSVNEATGYVLEEDTDPEFGSPTTVYSGANTLQSFTNKGAGIYYYRVRAVKNSVSSAWSNIEFVNVGPPPAPTLNAIDNADGNNLYTVSWSSVAGATSYIVEEANSNSFTNPRQVFAGSGSSTQVVVDNTGTYYYRVRSVNGLGNSAWSNVVSVFVSTIQLLPQPGSYSGSTPTVTFSVNDDFEVCNFQIRVPFQTGYCTVAVNTCMPLSNSGFEIRSTTVLGVPQWVRGTFSSSTFISGDYSWAQCGSTHIFPSTTGTWDASKQ